MDIPKFFAKKRDLVDQSNNGEVENKRIHELGNPKKNKTNLGQSLRNLCNTIVDGRLS